MTSRGLWLLAVLAVLLSHAGSAVASESYCVTCSGPQASYLCEVSIPDGVVPTQSPQLYCAYKLASDGHHASCASRRADAASCQGEPRKLAYLGPSLSGPATPTASPTEPVATTLPAEGASVPEHDVGANGTAVDAAPPAIEDEQVNPVGVDGEVKDDSRMTDVAEQGDSPATEDAERSTGDKIAGAAKTAFNCLASFFKECKE